MAEVLLHIPGKLQFGSDVSNLIGNIASEFGNRTLLLADYSLHEGRHIERVLEAFQRKGLPCILIDDLGVRDSSRTQTETFEIAKSSRVEVLLSMGGCSTLNAGRGLASRYKLSGATAEAQRAAYLEILTVFRFPFMFRNEYLEEDPMDQRLRVSSMPRDLYKGTLIDPGFMTSLSPQYAGTLMMDTLLQALEGFLSPESTFVSESLFRGALAHVGEGLQELTRGEKSLRHRVKASQGGVLSALGYATTRMGPAVALSFSLSSQFGIPKSWIGTVLLSHLADAYAESHPDVLSEAARLLGEDTFGLSPEEAANAFTSRIRWALAVLKLPTRLRDFDLKLPKLVEAVEKAAALNGSPAFHVPQPVDSLYDFLKRAF